MKRKHFDRLFFVLTLVASPVVIFLIWLKGLGRKKNEKSNILFIKLSGLGDILWSTPIYRHLKKNMPQARITLMVRPHWAPIFDGNKNVDEVITVDGDKSIKDMIKKIRQGKFTHVITLTPSVPVTLAVFWSMVKERVSFNFIEYGRLGYQAVKMLSTHWIHFYQGQYHVAQGLKMLQDYFKIDISKIDAYQENYEIHFTEKDVAKAKKWLADSGADSDKDFLVGMAIPAGNVFKMYPTDKFAKLADLLAEKYNAGLVAIGLESEMELIQSFKDQAKTNQIYIGHGFSINESAALFSLMRLFIGVDCGQMYLAHAAGAPIIDIIGPIDETEAPPIGNRCMVVKPFSLDCHPCSYATIAARSCKTGTMDCIKKTNPEDVMKVVEALIKECQIKN